MDIVNNVVSCRKNTLKLWQSIYFCIEYVIGKKKKTAAQNIRNTNPLRCSGSYNQ